MGFFNMIKMMKRVLTIALLIVSLSLAVMAQRRTVSATRYKEFKPSVITLKDGRKLKQPLTNVFLKNSSLLYLKGTYTMEANMDNVATVEFDDRSFTAINKQLAYMVDSVGQNALFCIELFDQDSYERNLRNNVNFSNIDFSGEQVGTTTVDMNNEDDFKLPVFRHYYLRLGGEFLKVHERELLRRLNKEQRTMLKRIIALPDFSWQDEQSLMTLLKVLTEE